MQEVEPCQILKIAKKDRHSYSYAAEPYATAGRDLLLYNISLKKDYTEEFEYVNYRRGLAFIEEIVDFKHINLTVARKGLRKFKDLLAEYVDLKQSHITTSKYHSAEKERLLANLEKSKHSQFIIYNTQKLNGENAQISFVYGSFWVIGSKNKTLLLQDQSQIKELKNKHQHKLTILIAECWFRLMSEISAEKLQSLKSCLNRFTLVGQYCNSENLQHLVDYGKEPKLFFYALVDKENRNENCRPTSQALDFCQDFSLPRAEYEIIKCQSIEQTIEKLKDLVKKISEETIRTKGQGSVVYVSGLSQPHSQANLLVCKVKTLEYRIFRRLRQKLKVYLEKFNKGYAKLLKQFSEDVVQMSRELKLHHTVQEYISIAERAFDFCNDENRELSRLISNKYITFLAIVKNKTIDKAQFLFMLKNHQLDEAISLPEESLHAQLQPQDSHMKEEVQQIASKQLSKKKLFVMIPMTIPSSGKSSLFSVIAKMSKFNTAIVSSDSARKEVMDQKLKRNKNMSKAQAYEKSRKQGIDLYYRQLAQAIASLSESPVEHCVLFLDKNHPENALKETLKQAKAHIDKAGNLEVKFIGVFPYGEPMANKGKYNYPFPFSYLAVCLKRILSRQTHQTLEGTEQHRFKIVIAFSNLLRNFHLSGYNLSKYFDASANFRFHQQQPLPEDLQQLLLEVLLSGKPGDFDSTHSKLDELIQTIRHWKIEQSSLADCSKYALDKIEDMFEHFSELKCE